ncbi:unnamed protein product (macronuclear) [Paramecium tetraurelia]|uniref:Uncharacterized protein n=1 Tax=Paramecium tetraurelia TaxID=5888 RepID=A0CPE3_PARTE|nr:uncharacterized protein GSPATT00009051001 [Paramecium tetraurelia]CAK72660.1 unnamed protein product [Paramecium tetraurelia]|eukprot:XP_001440057.1 hypothetical protein (macronuclear) [Paramecium tetraurelia strain d4-2]
MRVTVAPLQISRSLPPVPLPVMATPVMVDRVVNIHHSQVFHTDSPLKQQSEQKLKQLESRVQNLESQSPTKGKVEKLLEENEKLLQLVLEKTEHASKYKGELLTAKKEITKLKKVLDLKEEALTDMRIKSQSRSMSRASDRKAEQIMYEKQLLEQQYASEKQYLQNQIHQLKEVIESQSSQNQSFQNIDYQQQYISNPNQQIELFGQQPQQSGQIIRGSQKSIKKPPSQNQIQYEVPEYTNQQSRNPPAQEHHRKLSSAFQGNDQKQISPIKNDYAYDQPLQSVQHSKRQSYTQQDCQRQNVIPYEVEGNAQDQRAIRKDSQRQQSYKQPEQVQRKSISPTFEQQQQDQLNSIRQNQRQQSYKQGDIQRKSISPNQEEAVIELRGGQRQDHSRQPSYKQQIPTSEQQRNTHRKQSSTVEQYQVQIYQLNDELLQARHLEDELRSQINLLNQQLQEHKLMVDNLQQDQRKQQEQIAKYKQDLYNQNQELQKQISGNKDLQLQLQKLQRNTDSQNKLQDQKLQEHLRKQNILEKQLEESNQIIERLEQESQNISHKFEQEKDDLIKEYEEQLELKQQELIELNQSALLEKTSKVEFEIQLNQLKQKEANFNSEIDKIRKQKDLMKAQLEETQKSLNQAKIQISQIESEHSAQVELREQLETNYAILQKEYGEFKENSASQFNSKMNSYQQKAQLEYDKLKKQSLQQQSELDRVLLEKSELEQELNNTQQDLGHQYKEVTQQLQTAKQTINEQKKHIKQLGQQNQQLSQDHQELSVHYQQQESELNQLRQELQTQQDQCQSLRFDISRIQVDKAQLESSNKQQRQMDQLILENDSILHNNEQLQTDRNQLSDTLQQKESEIERQKKKIEHLKQLNQQNIEQIKKLQAELSEKEGVAEKCQNEFNNFQRQLQILRKENERLSADTQKYVEQLESEKMNSGKKLDHLQSQLQQQIIQRDQEYEDLDKSSRSAFVEIQSRKQEAALQQRRLEQQNDLIKQLSEQLEKVSQQNKNLLNDQQLNKQQHEQQQQEFEFTIKDLQANLQKQQYIQDELQKEIQKLKLQEAKQKEANDLEKEKMNQMMLKLEEKLEQHKTDTAADLQEYEIFKQTNSQLNGELERVRGENADLHEIVIQLQKENVSLRDHHQQMISQIEENHQATERLKTVCQQYEQEVILLRRQPDQGLYEQPKAGFIKTKNTKRMEDMERENMNYQKEIQRLKSAIDEIQNNQNYNSTPTPERKQFNQSQSMSQKKHLFEQKPKSIDNTIRKHLQ